MFFYREAMTCSSTAMSAVEEVRVCQCGSVANYFFYLCGALWVCG